MVKHKPIATFFQIERHLVDVVRGRALGYCLDAPHQTSVENLAALTHAPVSTCVQARARTATVRCPSRLSEVCHCRVRPRNVESEANLKVVEVLWIHGWKLRNSMENHAFFVVRLDNTGTPSFTREIRGRAFWVRDLVFCGFFLSVYVCICMWWVFSPSFRGCFLCRELLKLVGGCGINIECTRYTLCAYDRYTLCACDRYTLCACKTHGMYVILDDTLLYSYYILIIFLLYSWWYYIIFLLYSYYISIIFLMILYYILIIFLLYSYYILDDTILYSYYILIIFLLYSWWYYIIFLLYSYYILDDTILFSDDTIYILDVRDSW